ncbi:MAG: PAS domain S-box protein [Candidatus Heimdallarchaeaceae archaeon]
MNPEDNATLIQETFDIIFQNSMDMIYLVDVEGIIHDANIQACRYLGKTLQEIKNTELKKFIKEKRNFQELLKDTKEQGSQFKRLNFITKNKAEIPFHISSSIIKSLEQNFIVLMCRDITDLIDSAMQRKFLFELFQHDLLNNLHAELGYIDFFRRIFSKEKVAQETAEQLLNKMRDITIRSIYLIQNANINLLLQEERPLSNQKIADVISHAIRYLNNFFAKQIRTEVTHMDDLVVLGDEYLHRIIVNLIVRMIEYTDDKVEVEIYVTKPRPDRINIKLHFEGILLSQDAKSEILEIADLDTKKLDVAVTQNMLERYGLTLKIENIKRLGETVGTRMNISFPNIEWEKIDAEEKQNKKK